jgi:hypothetical protein
VPSQTHSDFSWEEGDERAVMIGPGMRVGFARTGGRWTHDLVLPDHLPTEVARVVESQPDRDEPRRVVSPVYQEVHRHEPRGGTGLCLLLTGLWFDHHFSAAVSLAAEPAQSDAFALDFDVADRCRAPIESLAATYVLGLDSGALAEASPDRIAWNLDGPSIGRLELLADSPCSVVLAEAGRQAMRVQVLAAIRSGDFTHRLRYRWRWTNSVARTR